MIHISTVAQCRVPFQSIGGLMTELVQQVARLNSIESVMARLNLGRSMVYAKLGSGELRSVKVGRRRLVPESALIDFINQLEAGGDAA
jgi:excisionase family DNA binding protein